MAGDAAPTSDRNLTAIAVREKAIGDLGSDEAITRNSPDALVTDLEGAVVMPVLKIPAIAFCGSPLIGSAFSFQGYSITAQAVEDDRRRTIRAGIKAYNQAGINTIRDPGLETAAFRFYQAVVPQERFLRASFMWRLDLGATLEERKAWIDDLPPVSGFGDQWLDIWGWTSGAGHLGLGIEGRA